MFVTVLVSRLRASRRRGGARISAFIAALVLCACSHEVESPDISIAERRALSPDLVCNAQLVTDIVIKGDGFRPAPTQALESPTVLVLPRVDLALRQDLEGTELAEGGADGGPTPSTTTLSGDPRDKDEAGNAENNTWQSEQQLTAIIDEDLALEPGIYDLTLTNPDKSHSATREGALAVVPPPRISEVRPPAVCVDQEDQELRLVGDTFLEYGDETPTVAITDGDGDVVQEYSVHTLENCREIPGRSTETRSCTDALFTVPEGDLAPGDYGLTLTNPGPAACSSTETIELEVNAPPKVDDVTPAQICSGGSVLVAAGEHFQQDAAGELRCGDDTVASTAVEVNDDGTMATLTFGPGAVPGVDCDVVVINPDGCEDRPLPHQTVVGTEGPILFNVSPPVVYNGINTQVKLFVTALEPPFEVQIAPAGSSDMSELTAILDPGNDRRLQATVPEGTVAGEYDVIVSDGTGCLAVLGSGLAVTDQEDIAIEDIEPRYGQRTVSNAVTLRASGSGVFAPTPIVFLSRADSSDEPAVQLFGVSVSPDGSSLTAVVPKDAPAGSYNVVVVDPSAGTVGVLDDAYTATEDPPPVVSLVTPQSIINADSDPMGDPQTITAFGTGFNGASVEVTCDDGSGNTSSPADVGTGTETCDGSGDCQLNVSLDGSGIPEGSACVVRVTNGDGSYGDYSAVGVTGPSLNLSDSRAGTDLNTARRALGAAAVKATSASRFVYAIGGDTGPDDASDPLDSVEFAAVDIFGAMQAWQESRHSLPSARSFAATVAVGRYIYVYGGSDGTDALASGHRALVLSPEETPQLGDIDLCLSGGSDPCFDDEDLGSGVSAGTYAYRIAATVGDTDPQNLGGETLAADPITVRLPDIMGRGILVQVTWSPPVDALGDDLTGITGYRIYRTPVDGAAGADEVLIAEVAEDARSWIDDGSQELGSDTPMPPGSTSRWQALPDLNTARASLRGVSALDNNDANTVYLYALLGKDSGSHLFNEGAALDSYEYLELTVAPNGRHAVASSWTQPATTFANARWDHGAWSADDLAASTIPAGQTWIYVGGGRTGANNTVVNNTEAAHVSDTGELDMFAIADAMDPSRTGFGTAAAAGRLFVFGGWPPSSPANDGGSYGLVDPTTLDNFNNEGGLSLGSPRYQMGSTLQSAFIFIVGGQDDIQKMGGTDNITGGSVTASTALIIQ